jgi:ATP-dependent DNA ligase
MVEFSPARLAIAKEIPKGPGWMYEPKFDGYRCLLGSNASGHPVVVSRNAKDLGRFFPELVKVAERLPAGSVVDGEIVQPTQEGVSFLQLQRRLMASIHERQDRAKRSPAALLAFDLLQLRSEDLRPLRLIERRRRLQSLVSEIDTGLLQLMLQVGDVGSAAIWLERPALIGIEGVVAKRDESYPHPTARRWRKIRRVSTIDVTVAGFVGDPESSCRLVVALPRDGDSKIIGTTQPISREEALVLRSLLPAATPDERPIWAPFEGDRHDRWFRVPAGLSAEVGIFHLDEGVLRQPARFLRWRFVEPPKSSRRGTA